MAILTANLNLDTINKIRFNFNQLCASTNLTCSGVSVFFGARAEKSQQPNVMEIVKLKEIKSVFKFPFILLDTYNFFEHMKSKFFCPLIRSRVQKFPA